MMDQIVQYLQTHDLLFRIIVGTLFLAILVGLFIIARKYEPDRHSNASRIRKMTTIVSLSAFSVILYVVPFLRFHISPPFPVFLEFNFSNVPILIGGFMFGPITGSMVVIVRFLAKLPFSESLGIGELQDLFIGLATVLIASIIYHHKRTKKSAYLGLASNVLTWTVMGILTNWLFILAFYIAAFGGFDNVYPALQIIPGITPDNYMSRYLLFAVLPFNLIASAAVSIITFFLYKRISRIYTHDFSFHLHHEKTENDGNKENA